MYSDQFAFCYFYVHFKNDFHNALAKNIFVIILFQIEGKAGAVGGEGVLQNFFNSLLNRRTGSPIGGPLASVRTPGSEIIYIYIFVLLLVIQ